MWRWLYLNVQRSSTKGLTSGVKSPTIPNIKTQRRNTMVSLGLCILWSILVTIQVKGEQPTGIIFSAIGSAVITMVCLSLGVK